MCVLCIYLNQKLYHIVSSTTAVLIVCVYWNREFYTSILVYLYTQVYRSIPNVYTSIHLCMYYINVYTWMIPVSYFLFCLIIALCVLTVLNFLCISFYLYFFFQYISEVSKMGSINNGMEFKSHLSTFHDSLEWKIKSKAIRSCPVKSKSLALANTCNIANTGKQLVTLYWNCDFGHNCWPPWT